MTTPDTWTTSNKAEPSGRVPGLYVVVGASDALGVGARRPRREAWPRLLHRQAFAGETKLVNLGVSGATVASALARQVPAAEQLAPDVVTVWLAVNDIVTGVPLEAYEARFDKLVGRLRRATADRLLVGNCPYLDRLPAYLTGCALGLLPEPDETNRIVDGYNAVIERAVARHDATLVDLRSAALRARRSGNEPMLFARDGFHPSTAGHRGLAATFAASLQPAVEERQTTR
jgi:lysophospholipase L1-like esterase